MSVFFGILLFYLIILLVKAIIRITIRLVNALIGNTGNTQKPISAPLRIFLIVILGFSAALTIISLNIEGMGYSTLVLIPIAVFYFPSVFAKLSIHLGLVNASYYLGKIALFRHHKDTLGGAIFFGWLASNKHVGETHANDITWLEKKLCSSKEPLGSGSIVMHILLKQEIADDAEIYNLLRHLRDINPNRLPGDIARYASRVMLAKDLASNDWKTIQPTLKQWIPLGYNPLAKWLSKHHRKYIEKKITPYIWIDYLLAGAPRWRENLPNLQQASLPPSLNKKTAATLSAIVQAEWWAENQEEFDYQLLDKKWKHLLDSEAFRSTTQKRIESLGCFDTEGTYKDILNSIEDQQSIRNADLNFENTANYQIREGQIKRLQIIARSINNRQHIESPMAAPHELEEWLSVAQLLKQLGTDEHTKSQAYHIIQEACWNWVVDLYKIREEKTLVYLISKSLYPYAKKYGEEKFAQMLYGLYQGHYE
ncbi:MAG: hypothetical protein KUG73_14430 [Pseudomonadales bacterium]|nr:hypothetical protein [Pseudomonadales bacterium]